LDSPMNAVHVWKVAIDPTDPQTIFAGTRPAALFRSTDGGGHWDKLPADMAEECPNVRIPRVTALTVDPSDHRMVWAGVEVDGVRRSRDRGETWTRVAGVDDPDIHDTAISINGAKTVLTSTPREIFASTDGGESWRGLGVGKHFRLRKRRRFLGQAAPRVQRDPRPGLDAELTAKPAASGLVGFPEMPQLSYVHGASGTPFIGDTIGVHFDRIAERFGARDALIVRHQRVCWTYRELQERVDAFAAGLLALGLRRGDRIGVWSPNNAEWVITQFA